MSTPRVSRTTLGDQDPYLCKCSVGLPSTGAFLCFYEAWFRVRGHRGIGKRSDLYPEAEIVSDRRRWLIAVFAHESAARDAAHTATCFGADLALIRIGDPIDALMSIRGEMREGLNTVVGAPAGNAATVITLPLAASEGTTLAVPDTQSARHVLLHAGAVRIDVVGAGGRPVDTLKARRGRLTTRREARHPRRARRLC